MTDKIKPEELNDDDLKDVEGGVGLLLPAVQKVSEAARKKPGKDDKSSASANTTKFASTAGGSPNV